MYLDSELVLSGTKSGATWTGQAICNSGATEASTDYIDTLAAGNAIAPGARLLVVSTAICAGTGTTLTISLQTCAESAFGSPTTLVASAAIAKAATTAGTVLMDVVIPPGVLRYLRVMYTGDNTFETTGSVVASIVLDSDVRLDRGL